MIGPFTGEYIWLSNFYPSVITAVNGDAFATAEHAYQAAKCNLITRQGKLAWDLIKRTSNPAKARRIGKKIKVRPDWIKIRIRIMQRIILQKFTKNIELKDKLIRTGKEKLIQVNCRGDTFWGQTPDGIGRNVLGNILMITRQLL